MSPSDSTTSRHTSSEDLLPGLLRVHRGQLMAVAVIGLVLGVIGLLFPGATLLTIAVLFGIYLIASGMYRITAAFVSNNLDSSMRWVTGSLGLLVVIAGILCLSNPFQSLVALALVIGIGWILEGIIDLVGGVRGTIQPRWFGWVSGIVSMAAGVAMFVLPAAGIFSLVAIGAILMIAVSITTLLTLPRKNKRAADAATEPAA
ncbi:MAG: HdeD family acid-resistance protein [Rhodoglobus sp.]